MKKNLLVVISLMVVMSVVLVVPVMAGSSDTTVVSGNPTAYVDVTVSGSAITMTLTPNIVNSDTSTHLDAIANCPTTISAVDPGTDSKPSLGYMVNTTTTGNDWNTDKLAAKMQISGTDAGVFTTTPVTDLAAASTLYTGSGVTASQALALSFDQAVAYSDPRLPNLYSYRIPVTFTITAM